MKINNFKISIVVPVYNEEGNIEKLINKLVDVLNAYQDYEIIFIDDGSVDNTLEIIKNEKAKNYKINYLSFSRNFGHQNALRAGLDYSTGDCVISMDGDMQHPPEIIPQLIEKWLDGYEIVYTIRRDNIKTSFFKKITSNYFYKFINKISDIKIEKGAADFRLLDKSVVEVVKSIKENDLFMRGMISWLGFKQFAIEYTPEERYWGKTKYTLKKMIRFAVSGITSFSLKPLRVSTTLGYIIAGFSFLYGIYAIIVRLFTSYTISGWASVLVAVLFIGGIQLIMIGILGEYIGRLFIESKKRPNYIIKEKSF